MAKKLYEEQNIANIANNIREKIGGDKTYKTSEMDEGINEVFEAGKQEEDKSFWSQYQLAGGETNCDYMFAGQGWKATIFKPKYNIKPTRAQYMFSLTGIQGDLVALCEKQGKIIDFSNCKLFNGFAGNAYSITRFGVIDISKATDNITFINCKSLVTIDKLIVSSTTKYNQYAFEGVTKLENLIVEGTIAQNNFRVHYCTLLSKVSIESIINCLSTETSGLIVTLSLDAVKKAFETSSGANDGNTTTEWEALVASKPNWTITLS